MKGYKATDKDMKCRGFQFKLGEWFFETEEPLKLCESGFHFCKHPSGVYSYYASDCRVFEVEAEGVLDAPETPGAEYKLVCSRIKFVKEIFPAGDQNTGNQNTGNQNTGNQNTGDQNTGDQNTGNQNTGDQNTGNWNTGDQNTGNWNTGDQNTGHWNTGDQNTGHWNTGNRNTGGQNTGNRNTGDQNTGGQNTGDQNTGGQNTGNRNTGNWNTGDQNTGDQNTGNQNTGNQNTGDQNTGNQNTGDQNTGDQNTGNQNTGHGNATDYGTGFFCQKEQKVLCFDVDTGLSREGFRAKYPEYEYLLSTLFSGEVDWARVKNLPGITKLKLNSLLKKHREVRKGDFCEKE